MTGQEDSDGDAGQLRQEAAAWFARMRGPEAEQHRGAFEAWLARGALHRAAYNRIAETFSAGKVLKDEPQGTLGFLKKSSVRAGMLGGILMFFVLVVWGVAGDRSPTTPAGSRGATQYVSVIGQMRRIPLADGSVVTLDSDSLLSVRFDRTSRYLRLERGRARFEVSHDGRPFAVIAGNDRVVAHGTVFDVGYRDDGSIEVALLRGAIDVSRLEPGKGRSARRQVTLEPGQRLVVAPHSDLPAPEAIGHEADWTRQLAIFDRAPLSDVVAAANRYSVDKIVIPDPAVARLRVSGTFRIVDARRLCTRLAEVFGLTVDESTPGIIVLRRQPPK
ncbi:FecR domain-containing protein [Hephaestia sp. CMS5P-6]|nr:FecR domain-containing protein [Hephaestia mangrovi]